MANIEKEYPALFEREGGYVDAPTDRGGPTNTGITLKTLRAAGYNGDIKTLSEFVIKHIYKKYYWDKIGLDAVINQAVASILFDTAVNQGPAFAAKILQRSLNALNRNQLSWFDLILDGVAGPKTIARVNALNRTDTQHLIKLIFILRGARYVDITEKDNIQKINIRSWLNRMKLE